MINYASTTLGTAPLHAYAHFYASQIEITLQIMVKIDHEKPLLDYHSFLIGPTLNFY